MLREAIESYLPANALAATKAAEESEREGLMTLGAWTSVRGIDEAVKRMGGRL